MLRHNYEIGQLKKLVKNSSKVTKDEFLSHIGVHHTPTAGSDTVCPRHEFFRVRHVDSDIMGGR